MIALDANVLVRFLVEDDSRQGAAAAACIERAIADGDQLFIADAVLCELVWVLTASYDVPRRRIIEVVTELLRARHIVVDASDVLVRSLDAFAQGKGDFADYVIQERAIAAGCTTVVTFDRTLLREEGFTAP